jgi:hypothetical protein
MKNPFAIMAAPLALSVALALTPGARVLLRAPQAANSAAPGRSYVVAQDDPQTEIVQDDQGGETEQQPEEAATPDVSVEDSNENATQDGDSATEDANQAGGDAGETQPDAGVEPVAPESNQ